MFSNDVDSENYERFRYVWDILSSDCPSDSDLNNARKYLDKMKERDAEWNYVQAAVCFRKSWYLECRRHIKKAMKLEPETGKYKEAYEELSAMADEAKKEGKQIPTREFDGCAEVCCESICNCV